LINSFGRKQALPCMHEFVISADRQKARGVRAMDIAKRLIDYGIHPPTMYFPMIVSECIMVEPTETEARATLDEFVDVMRKIADEALSEPDRLHQAPWTTPVRRVDEVKAAREPNLRWRKKG
jgi:glycine dehydrogenase subunit 2